MSTRILFVVIGLVLPRLLLGCSDALTFGAPADNAQEGGDDDDMAHLDDDDAGDDDLSGGGCEIQGTVPVDGDPIAYYRESLQVIFVDPVDEVLITLEGDSGEVPGEVSLSEDGLIATFDPHGESPDNHLNPSSTYQATVDAGGCWAEWTFTTSVLGSDLAEDFTLRDAVYIVYPEQAQLVEPKGVDSLLGMLGFEPFLLAVDEVSGSELGLTAAGLDLSGLEQDPCAITADLTEATPALLTGSHLSLSPALLDIPFQQQDWSADSEYWLDGAHVGFEAEFTPDGEILTEGRIEGVVDGFALDALLAEISDDHDTYWQGSTCDLLGKLGSPCSACPGYPEQQSCITFELRDVEAHLLDHLEIEIVTAEAAASCLD